MKKVLGLGHVGLLRYVVVNRLYHLSSLCLLLRIQRRSYVNCLPRLTGAQKGHGVIVTTLAPSHDRLSLYVDDFHCNPNRLYFEKDKPVSLSVSISGRKTPISDSPHISSKREVGFISASKPVLVESSVKAKSLDYIRAVPEKGPSQCPDGLFLEKPIVIENREHNTGVEPEHGIIQVIELEGSELSAVVESSGNKLDITKTQKNGVVLWKISHEIPEGFFIGFNANQTSVMVLASTRSFDTISSFYDTETGRFLSSNRFESGYPDRIPSTPEQSGFAIAQPVCRNGTGVWLGWLNANGHLFCVAPFSETNGYHIDLYRMHDGWAATWCAAGDILFGNLGQASFRVATMSELEDAVRPHVSCKEKTCAVSWEHNETQKLFAAIVSMDGTVGPKIRLGEPDGGNNVVPVPTVEGWDFKYDRPDGQAMRQSGYCEGARAIGAPDVLDASSYEQ